ncbi:MAG: hypothetical protein WBZ31_02740 [Thiobacillus sp.]
MEVGLARLFGQQARQPVGLVEIEPRAGEAEAFFQPQHLGQPRRHRRSGVARGGDLGDQSGLNDRAIIVVQQRGMARREFGVAGQHRARGAVERDVRQLGANRGRQRRDQIPQCLAPDVGALVFLQRAEVTLFFGDDRAFGVDDAAACARCAEINTNKIQLVIRECSTDARTA